MKKQSLIVLLIAFVLAACLAQPVAAQNTKSQLIQIQTQLQILQDNMARMQQTFDERMGAMRDLVTQQTDNVNKMGTPSRICRSLWARRPTTHPAKLTRFPARCRRCMIRWTSSRRVWPR